MTQEHSESADLQTMQLEYNDTEYSESADLQTMQLEYNDTSTQRAPTSAQMVITQITQNLLTCKLDQNSSDFL